MNILVTGCAGFIGSHVTKALLKRGDVVLGIDNLSGVNYPSAIKQRRLDKLTSLDNFSFKLIDIRKKEEVAVLKEHSFDAVIHLAALPGVGLSMKHPELYEQTNIAGTRHILEIAGNAKILYASSSSVYGGNTKIPFHEDDPTDNQMSVYAWTKKSGEGLCRFFVHQYGKTITCMRFFNVYGPDGRPDMAPHIFTKLLLEESPITIFGDGEMKRDWTYIDDIVKGILAILDHKSTGFSVVNLGNNTPFSTNELLGLLEEITGKQARRIPGPERQGDVPMTYADISRAQNTYKWQPLYSLQEGLTRFVEWFRQWHD